MECDTDFIVKISYSPFHIHESKPPVVLYWQDEKGHRRIIELNQINHVQIPSKSPTG